MSKTKLDQDKEAEMRRKVFVGGINKSTTEAHLESYFSGFGDIEDILVNRSAKTGASKGCAFILFKKQEVAQKLINDPSKHEINGKMAECKASHKKGSKKMLHKKKPEEEQKSGPQINEASNQPDVARVAPMALEPQVAANGDQTPARKRNTGTDVEQKCFAKLQGEKSTLQSILSKSQKVQMNCGPSNVCFRQPKPCGLRSNGSCFKLGNFALQNARTSDLKRITFFDRSRVNYWRHY